MTTTTASRALAAQGDVYGDPYSVLSRVRAATVGIVPQDGQPAPDMCGAGVVYYRELDDGRCIAVYPLLMGTVRVVIGATGDVGYDDAWCYSLPAAGLIAARYWDGNGDPPEGWFRHVGSGRRRPEGNPDLEYILR